MNIKQCSRVHTIILTQTDRTMIIQTNKTPTEDNTGYVVEYFDTQTQETSIKHEEPTNKAEQIKNILQQTHGLEHYEANRLVCSEICYIQEQLEEQVSPRHIAEELICIWNGENPVFSSSH